MPSQNKNNEHSADADWSDARRTASQEKSPEHGVPSETHRLGRSDVTASGHANDVKVYWHRELPPLEAEVVAEHSVEANSGRVPGTIAHRDELWDQCYRELMANAESRLVQEITRLGGHFAHVHGETIDPKHDDAAGEAWLHGRFSYVLYRRAHEPG